MDSKGELQATRFYQSQLFRRIVKENPLVLIDVGARDGIHKKWQPFKGAIKVIGFEPDENECKQLNKVAGKNDVYFPVALSNKRGKIKLNLTHELRCSSIFKPNYALINRFLTSENYEVTNSIEVPCDTLDEIVKTADVKDIDFIKLDTQGSELQILEGAGALGTCGLLQGFCVRRKRVLRETEPGKGDENYCYR